MERDLRLHANQNENPFGRWLLDRGYTNRRFAGILGCHWVTVSRWRSNWAISPFYSRVIRSLFPDCPIPVKGSAGDRTPLILEDLP